MALTILLIHSDEERGRALEEKLAGFARVLRADGADLAARVEAAKPDLVIIDMSLPDRDALEDIRAVAAANPVVMFAGTDDPDFAQEAIAAGVCSYNLSGVAYADIKPIMASAIALFQRYRHVETELAAATRPAGRAPPDRARQGHPDEGPQDDRAGSLSLAAEESDERKPQAGADRGGVRRRA